MLSHWRSNPQPSLLERYWTALRRDRAATPPDGLDSNLAELARCLASNVDQLDPPIAVVSELRQRIAPRATTDNNHAPRWSGPAVDPVRQRRSSRATNESGEMLVSSHDADLPPELIRSRRRNWPREALKLTAAAIAFAIVGAVLALTLHGDGDDARPAVGPPLPTPAATTQSSPESDVPTLDPARTTIPVGRNPWGLAVGAGSVWVSNGSDGTVSRIDPSTNTVVATIHVYLPGNQTATSIAADDRAVWVMAGTSRLVHIDPATNEVAEVFPVEPPVDTIALDDGVLWAMSRDSNMLRRFDPATKTFTATIQIVRPFDVIVTAGAVWVLRETARGTDTEMLKIDPVTATVVATISLDNIFAWYLRAEGASIWLTTNRDTLVQIDTVSSQVVASYPYPADILGVPTLEIGSGSVWVCACTGEAGDAIWQFDLSTRQWSAQISVEDLTRDSDLLVLDDALWVYNDEDELVRIQLTD